MANKKVKEIKDIFVYENCNVCGDEFYNVEDILIDIDKDTYICEECASKNNEIHICKCASEYNEEEI